MKRAVLVFVLSLVPVIASAEALTLTTQSGDRTLVATDSGDVHYASANGMLRMRVHGRGFEAGAFALQVSDLARTGDVVSMHVVVKHGDRVVEDDVVINQKTLEMTTHNRSEVSAVLREFVATPDGQLLLEAQALIQANLSKDGRIVDPRDRGPRRTIGAEWSWSGCGVKVLNAVAGGAGMVAGCAGAVACTACCVSGGAWYGSALLDIATSDACVFV